MTATTATDSIPKAKAKRTVAKKKSALAKSAEKKTKIQAKSALMEDKKRKRHNKETTAVMSSPGPTTNRKNGAKTAPIKVTLGRTRNKATKKPTKGEEDEPTNKQNGARKSKATSDTKKPTQKKKTTTTKARGKAKKDPPSADELSFENDTSEALAAMVANITTPMSISTITSQKKAKANNDHAGSPSSSSMEKNEEDDRAACCLCHCALDYSDRAAFFEADRQKEIEEHDNNDSSDDESLYYQPTDPYVPQNLFDPSNALVYCDGCNRLYHQKCHFVPLMVVPRGTWNCLVCSTAKSLTNKRNAGSKGKEAISSDKKESKGTAPFTKAQIKRMFQSPPPPAKQQQYLTQDENLSSVYHSPDEKQWEIVTKCAKAALWNKTLTQTVKGYISSALGNWRQAETAFETLTRTQQNRKHFLETSASSSRGSQELAQTLVKMAGAKLRMRQIVMNLEQLRINPERHVHLIHQWCKAVTDDGVPPVAAAVFSNMATNTATAHPPPKSFLERLIFPFGQYPPRTIPRTAEMEEIEQEEALALKPPETNVVKSGTSDIPNEIITTTSASTVTQSISSSKKKLSTEKTEPKADNNKVLKSKKETKSATAKDKKSAKKGKNNAADTEADSDSSSGISLEDLKCCICLIGDATDEDDLLLCDGKGCFRAYHMQCLEPRVTQEEVEATEDEDWFCPLCSSLAECMHMIQSNTMGDDWDRRRIERDHARALAAKKQKKSGKDNSNKEADCNDNHDDDDDDSLKSWDLPTQVFPRAEWEYETALQLKSGNRNDATNALLRLVLGDGEDEEGDNALDNISDGTDDEEIDGHFDPEAFEEERRRQREELDEDEDGDSTHSSQATLVDMSSVELNIEKDELNALSEGSDSDSDESDSDDDGEEGGEGSDKGQRKRERERRRRSRRLRHRKDQEDAPKQIGVDYDPSNIVQGKRRRKPVDYKKLNEAMFGELDEKELANIDDKEDFRVPIPRKKVSSGSDNSDNGSESDSGSDSDNDSDGSGDDSSNSQNEDSDEKKAGKKRTMTGKRRRPTTSEDEDTDSGNEAESDDSSVDSKSDKKAKKLPAKKKKRLSKGANATKTAKKRQVTSRGKGKNSTLAKENGVKKPSKSTDTKAKSKQKNAPTAKAKSASTAKKPRGRPPKASTENAKSESTPKKPRGRPPKASTESTPKKPRGRPPKASTENAKSESTPKKPRGRPPKQQNKE